MTQDIASNAAPALQDERAQMARTLLPDCGHYVTAVRGSRGFAHHWDDNLDRFLARQSELQDTPDVFFGTASFHTAGPRKQANVRALRALRLDIDAGREKYAKHGGAVYPSTKIAGAELGAFIKSTGLAPTYIVVSGGGGLHVYWAFDRDLTPDEWRPLASTLASLCKAHQLKVDTAVTEDTARILRLPGMLHSSGTRVRVLGKWAKRWQFDEMRAALGQSATALARPVTGRKFDTGVNAEVVQHQHRPFSVTKAAQGCAALRHAMADKGTSTPYGAWLLLLGTAKASIEGADAAHEFSSGHANYNETDTARKLESLTGGPPPCDTWATTYGNGGPCDSCAHRGRIKNPIVLGYAVETTPPGASSEADEGTSPAPDWVLALNERFALVRMGSKVVIADFRTPNSLGSGYSLGYLEVGALHAMFAGRYAPADEPGGKARALSAAWLAHPMRRQYEGAVFNPGETLPDNILNLWRGFVVQPATGDVTPWLRVLAAVVPDGETRNYVLRWIAWKVQNPGGVPDTILIFTGGKGTGKNSLFDPVLSLFGSHAMLADNPEQIAGRFNGHLIDKAFAVLDEAVFTGDPRQMDTVKSRVTAKVTSYERKGLDPVQGVNRCAFVMLTNHAHVWQATTDERRAVIVEAGDALQGEHAFWIAYHAWVKGDGPAALLHHLQTVDVSGFNPRAIPRGEALARQIELTALRDPVAAWWHRCLTEGAVGCNGRARVTLNETEETLIDADNLRESFEQSARHAYLTWPVAARTLRVWCGGLRTQRAREGIARVARYVLPPAIELRATFSERSGVRLPPMPPGAASKALVRGDPRPLA